MTREFAILIVDDDADIAQNLQDILETKGYSTMLALDGQTALALGKEKVFGLGLIDIGLPDMPGVELIEKLASISPGMEYIIITGQASLQTAIQAVERRNIIAYETKPLNIDQLMALVRQVAERKQVEEALRHSEQNLKTYLESAPDGICIYDLTGTFLYGNRRAEEIIGYKKEELIGKSFLDINLLSAKYLLKARELLALSVAGRPTGPDELELIRKDGSHISVEVKTTLIKQEGGAVVIGFVRDITERKAMEQQLQHSQLLASLGEMTAGIAHEVGNPLASILLYSEAVMKGGVSRQNRKDLKVIQNEARRAGKLMRDLLTYSHKLAPKMRRSNLHSILKKVLDMRQYEERVHNISVSTNLLDGPLYVKSDSSQLTQVFLNLMLNAEEALMESNGGNIIITTEIEGERAKISIADDGTGIPEDKLSQVFHPFFTTKSIGEGTGLGLSTCYGIITSHKGLIWAENNDMGGATFTVELPLVKARRQANLR